MSKEWAPDDVFDVLASETAREILLQTQGRQLSARELAEECETSRPTVYRRINRLREYDLLGERTVIDDAGNHYSVYETNVNRICFDIVDGEFVVTVRASRDLVDRFGATWRSLQSTPRSGGDQS
ncbi:MAG: ArsR/SmtB family transcription factor [Salinigranum sp.]